MLERFEREREREPLLTSEVLFNKKKEVLTKRKQRRLPLCGFGAQGIIFEVVIRLPFCCYDDHMDLGFLGPFY